MTPDQVIQKLEVMGVKITRRTLLNYEKWGLIPPPERGGGGPGGRYAKYPISTVAEAYATYSLLNGTYDNGYGLFNGGKTPVYSPKAILRAKEWVNSALEFRHVYIEKLEAYYKYMDILDKLANRDESEFKHLTSDLEGDKIKLIEEQVEFIVNMLIEEIWRLQYVKAMKLLKIPY